MVIIATDILPNLYWMAFLKKLFLYRSAIFNFCIVKFRYSSFVIFPINILIVKNFLPIVIRFWLTSFPLFAMIFKNICKQFSLDLFFNGYENLRFLKFFQITCYLAPIIDWSFLSLLLCDSRAILSMPWSFLRTLHSCVTSLIYANSPFNNAYFKFFPVFHRTCFLSVILFMIFWNYSWL